MSSTWTEDELVAHLRNSSLPTLFVEGKGDIEVYRWIENKIGVNKINFISCGGREQLFQLFSRRSEFPSLKCAFFADRDMYVMTEIPNHYDDIIFTDGFSIENDILDSDAIIKLMIDDQLKHLEGIGYVLSQWFSFEGGEFIAGRPAIIDRHTNNIVTAQSELAQELLRAGRHRLQDDPLFQLVLSKWKALVRGHNVLHAFHRAVHWKRRDEVKFNERALLFLCVSQGSPRFEGHLERIRQVIGD
jgi:hypothetical protein